MITTKQIEAAIRQAPASGKERITLKDPGDRGAGRLTVIVRPMASGKVLTEFYAVWHKGKSRRSAKIGTYPAIGLSDARRKFQADYTTAISSGHVPRGRKIDTAGSLESLFTAYIDHLERSGKRGPWQAKLWLLGPSGAARKIGGHLPAAAVTPDDLMPYLSGFAKRGARASLASARAYLAAAFRFGIRYEHDPERVNAEIRWGIKSNPVDAIAPTRPGKAGDRFLSPAELRIFWRWLIPYQRESSMASALLLKLATGQRSEEILRIAKVERPGMAYYDSSARTIQWPTTKNRLPHSIPLPRQAVEILEVLPALRGLVFPNQLHPDQPASANSMAGTVRLFIQKHPGFKPFTPRDLRRTWKTLAGMAEISKVDRDLIQNHAKGDVSARHYDRYSYAAEKKAAMRTWEIFLQKIIDGEPLEEPSEVVSEVIEVPVPNWARGDYRPPAK